MNHRRKLLSALTALTLASAAPSAGQAADDQQAQPGGLGQLSEGKGPQLAQLSTILAQAAPELIEHFRHCLQDGITNETLTPNPAIENLLRLDARTLACVVQLQSEARHLQIQQAEIY